MATARFLTTPASGASNREIDVLLVESTQKSRKRLMCNKTFLIIFIVSLLLLILTGITIAMVVWVNDRSSLQAKQDVLDYPVICCNAFTHKALCIHFNASCEWSNDEEECDFIASPNIFENDLCFPSIDEDESCSQHELEDESEDYWDEIPQFEVREELLQSPSPTQPEVIYVTDGVYVAIGYDLANAIFIETTNGIIVIDTLSQTSAATNAFSDYRKMRLNRSANHRNSSQMLIEAIILTHYHADHVMAISFWVDLNKKHGFDITPKIYANKGVVDGFKDFMIYARTPRSIQAARQFGTVIREFYDEDLITAKNMFISAGIGPFLSTTGNFSFINPLDERFFVLLSDADYALNIDEVTLLLIHSPGETQDQISVWYQAKQILFIGDNFYYAFPNLYEIRGTTARDPKKWILSLDKLIKQYPDIQYLVSSHSLPISENIIDELRLYRDNIAFVHDQTIRYMTAGLSIDEIVFNVENTRPRILKQGRNQQLYATIEWSVRSIYDLYMGWFDGDSSSLYPSNAYHRGQGLYLLLKKFHHHKYANEDDMIRLLISYLNDVLQAAEDVHHDLNYVPVITTEERWVLEIVTSLSSLYSEYKQCDEWTSLMKLRWNIMQKVAGRSISANGRNYLISQYLEERFYKTFKNEDDDDDDDDEGEAMDDFTRNVFMHWPIEWVVELLRYRVNPMAVHDSTNTDWKTNIKFVDSGLMFQLWIRNGGVLSIEEYSTYNQIKVNQFDNEASLIYEMNEADYKLQKNIANISFVAKGTQSEMSQFWSKFDGMILE